MVFASIMKHSCKFEMADIIARCIYALVFLSLLSAAQVTPRNTRRNGKRNVADPVSDFFSELGDLFLDVDRSFSVQSAPKVESQEDIIGQLFRPPTDYFNKVQENYKTLQNRLGNIVRDSIGPKSVYRDRDLTTVGPLILDEDNLSTDMPSETAEKAGKSSEGSNVGQKRLRKPLQKVYSERLADNECSEGKEDASDKSGEQCSKLELDRRQRVRESIQRKIADIKRINDLLSAEAEEILKPSRIFSKRDGQLSESRPNPDGRLFGDILYSESSFDKYIRQLLRDHGKWVLDNPLLSRWRKSGIDAKDGAESSVTQTEIPVTTVEVSTDIDIDSDEESTEAITNESETERSNFESRTKELHMRSKDFYTIVDDDGVVEEEIDVILSPSHSDRKIKDVFKITNRLGEKAEAKETVILAFTPNGVPLKLRMGPEIKNPVRFLNGALKFAGVSLNVPVESYDDIEPVGKEVMKYGTGVLTRAIYLDLSKDDELKTLLKTLMKSKPSKI